MNNYRVDSYMVSSDLLYIIYSNINYFFLTDSHYSIVVNGK